MFSSKNTVVHDLPLKRGLSLQIEMGDSDANCPNDTSRKNRGIPHRVMNNRYGMRNTAENIPIT